jgi:hypothetical protein
MTTEAATLMVLPEPPAHLDTTQAGIWRATAGFVGVELAGPALIDLEAFAVETARYQAAEAHLREHGDVLVLRSDKGDVLGSKEAPELRIARSARDAADTLAERLKLYATRPVCRCGATMYSTTDPTRCARGHVLVGNGAALVTGATSVAFWTEAEAALEATAAGILADRGHGALDAAPVALRLAARGAAQAALVRDAAYRRMLESGGPLSGSDRERGAHRVWAAASDRLLRHAQAIGFARVAQPAASPLDYIAGKVGE